MTPFERALRDRIRSEGPLTLEAYMEACNSYYYATRDPLGASGDFTTARTAIALALIPLGAWMWPVAVLFALWGLLATAAPVGWWSWIARLLPELDERALYERVDLRQDVWTNCNKVKPCTSQQLAVLLCPSDPHNRRIYESDMDCPGGEAYALTNYLGCRGSTRPPPPPITPAIDLIRLPACRPFLVRSSVTATRHARAPDRAASHACWSLLDLGMMSKVTVEVVKRKPSPPPGPVGAGSTTDSTP